MSNARKILLFLGDVFLLYFSLLITTAIGFGTEFNSGIFALHLIPFSIIYGLWLVIIYISGLYDLQSLKTRTSFYASSTGAIGMGLVMAMLFFYAFPFFDITPKTNLVINAVVFVILFVFWRRFFYSVFSLHFLSNTAIIGSGPEVEALRTEINERPYLGYKIIPVDPGSDLFSQIQNKNIDVVIFTEEFESNPKMLKALYFCLPARVKFLEFAKAYELVHEKIPIDTISHSWFLENLKEGEKGFYDQAKRIFDIVIASIILILTSPLWILISIAVKLEDRGPVFYHQERIGKDRKSFILHKFRSMETDAEKNGAVWAKKNDKRVTKVGKVLRRSHLDELPQMINVLKGDISLVGPRPERPEFVKELEEKIPHYHLRHIIKPGFTGWAQIKFRYGRSVMDSYEKFQYDLYYLKNRSFLLDISILLKTFQLFFRKPE